MTWHSSIALAAACFIFMATPGPGTMALVGHTLANGFRRSTGFILGMVAGDLLYLAFAILGMAMIARSFEDVFTVIRLAAAGYLVYLGIRAWRAIPAGFNDTGEPTGALARGHYSKSFTSGLLVTLSNPKVIMFYVGFLPGFADLGALSPFDIVVMVGVVIGVLVSLMTGYALAAGRARQMMAGTRAVRALNRGSGSVMIGAGIFIALRG